MNHVRVIRFDHAGTPRYGIARGDTVEVLTDAPWRGGAPAGEELPLEGLRLLAPVEPTKVVCVGRNYAAHAAELGNQVPAEPLIFIKPASSVIGPDEPIVLPRISGNVQHEAELAVVIGKRTRNVPAAQAADHIAGFTCLNDVTARDIQRAETQFTRAKSFDSFCPIGPWIVPGMPEGDRMVRCTVNGAVRQESSTASMIHDVASLLAFMSRVMTLEPGDVISTGTPAGVEKLQPGDIVNIEIEGVGVLSNPVVNEE
ncbi:fumarylacetoacetate hydrolase family protein [Vulgatibacter sp.]|uniref:fumarylacetoacetate hydrolase family protein n=1 Tax=Vulgatibacter sp. TaxID=1971226 RepID=UPI003566DD0C